MDQLCYLCLVFFMFSRLFIAALWAPAGIGLTSWLLLLMFNCVFVTFPCGLLGQAWYLIVSIPDLCHLSYFGNYRHINPCKSNVILWDIGKQCRPRSDDAERSA